MMKQNAINFNHLRAKQSSNRNPTQNEPNTNQNVAGNPNVNSSNDQQSHERQRNRIVRHVYNVNPLRPNPLPVPDLTLASGSYDNTIRLWNPDKGYCEKLLQYSDNSHVNSKAFLYLLILISNLNFFDRMRSDQRVSHHSEQRCVSFRRISTHSAI